MANKKRNQALNEKRKVKKLRARDSLHKHTLNLEKKLLVVMKEKRLLKIRRLTNQVIYTSVVDKERNITKQNFKSRDSQNV